MKYKIAIICPYFGKFPSSINLTFYSMFKNSFIDWFIFSDNEDLWSKKYSNVCFVQWKFEDMQRLATELFETVIDNPYKMCDYKPAYGFMFYEYVKEYDFWGYCDVDVLFGNLAEFFTDEKLNRNDKIYDLGHLSLYRNVKGVREGFMGTEKYYVPYKDIFNHKYICVFDEYYGDNAGINQVLSREGYKVYINHSEIADIDIKYRNFHIHNHPLGSDYYFSYEEDKLCMKRFNDPNFSVSVAYAHFQQKKDLPVLCEPSDFFVVTPKGFMEKENLDKACFYRHRDFKLIWYVNFRLRRLINKYKARIWQKTHPDISKYKFKLE